MNLETIAVVPAWTVTKGSIFVDAGPHDETPNQPRRGDAMNLRLKIAWRAMFGGPIGPIGWCGQAGYWWIRPCPHVGVAAGCGWFDGEKVVRGETP